MIICSTAKYWSRTSFWPLPETDQTSLFEENPYVRGLEDDRRLLEHEASLGQRPRPTHEPYRCEQLQATESQRAGCGGGIPIELDTTSCSLSLLPVWWNVTTWLSEKLQSLTILLLPVSSSPTWETRNSICVPQYRNTDNAVVWVSTMFKSTISLGSNCNHISGISVLLPDGLRRRWSKVIIHLAHKFSINENLLLLTYQSICLSII